MDKWWRMNNCESGFCLAFKIFLCFSESEWLKVNPACDTIVQATLIFKEIVRHP